MSGWLMNGNELYYNDKFVARIESKYIDLFCEAMNVPKQLQPRPDLETIFYKALSYERYTELLAEHHYKIVYDLYGLPNDSKT